MKIAVDFDGTLAVDRFPKIGPPVKLAIETCQELQKQGHKVYLWTCRSDEYLKQAVQWAAQYGLLFDGINCQIDSRFSSPKMNADLFIDDRAAGAPLIPDNHGGMVVNWAWVRWMLKHRYNINLNP